MERHLRVQGRTAARTVAQSPRIVPEATHVSLVREIPALAETVAATAVTAAPAAPPAPRAAPERTTPERTAPQWAAPGRAAIAPTPLPQPAPGVEENREAQSLPQPAPAAKPAAAAVPQPVLKPIGEPKPQPASWTETPPAQQPQEETPHWLPEEPPWWLTHAPTHADSPTEQPRAPRAGTWHSVAAHDGQTVAAAEVREEEKAADEMPTRLSGLRGLLFSLGVKELSPKKRAEPDGNGNGAPADAAPSHPEQTIVTEALVPQPEPERAEAKVEAKEEEPASRRAAPRWVTAEPEFLPPPVEETNKGKESRWNRRNDDTGARDDIQILPSRRGQYKR